MTIEVESTGITTAGTPFTVYSETLVGGDRARWSIADSAVNLPDRHGVLYLHGAGSGADAFTTISQFKTTRYAIIDFGGIYVECYGNGQTGRPASDGQYNWGRDFARDAYRAAAQHVAGIYDIQDWVVLARSMGGLVGAWMATQDPWLAQRCIGMIHLSAIYDMLAEFDNANHFDLPSYYGTPAGDRAALATATATNDPKRFAASLWTGLDVCVIYGTADVTARPDINALALWADHSNMFGPNSQLVAVPDATHSQSGGTYGSPAQAAFLRTIWGVTPPTPEPGTIYNIIAANALRSDGLLHPVTLG